MFFINNLCVCVLWCFVVHFMNTYVLYLSDFVYIVQSINIRYNTIRISWRRKSSSPKSCIIRRTEWAGRELRCCINHMNNCGTETSRPLRPPWGCRGSIASHGIKAAIDFSAHLAIVVFAHCCADYLGSYLLMMNGKRHLSARINLNHPVGMRGWCLHAGRGEGFMLYTTGDNFPVDACVRCFIATVRITNCSSMFMIKCCEDSLWS